MEYILHILIVAGIYVILSVSLDLIAGYTGLLSIAHAAFFAIGAYSAALLVLKLHVPFPLNVACAAVLCGLLGAAVGAPGLRIRDDYFVVATFAFQIIVLDVLNNWSSLTGGPLGLPGIPRPVLLGWQVTSRLGFLALVGLFCMLSLWVCRRIVKSPVGRVLQSIREDEVLALAAGKSVSTYKILAFSIGAGMAGVGGALYAHYIGFVDPTSFTIAESIFILSIVIIGGAGSLWGPAVGALVLVALPELLRFTGMPSSVAANVRQVIYGSLLVAFMIWRPRGFLGKHAPGRSRYREPAS